MRAVRSRSLSGSGPVVAAPARLQLTSLVDMMVILVVFLLKSFSVEGQLVAPAAGLELPNSSSRASAESGLVVAVGTGQITVAGRAVVATADLLADEGLGREALQQALDAERPIVDTASVLIQADRRTDYRHLREVLSACAAAGWREVSLVVMGAGS